MMHCHKPAPSRTNLEAVALILGAWVLLVFAIRAILWAL